MIFQQGDSSHVAVRSALESRELRTARARGWLTLTSGSGDRLLQRWQRECEQLAQPFAVVRMEPQRATLWFILREDQEWTPSQQEQVRSMLAGATGCVVQANSACAFAKHGAEHALMKRLLTAAPGPNSHATLQHQPD